MSELCVLNDLHCGAIRSGGTTPKTAWALRQWILQRFGAMLSAIDSDLMILGDLLDTFSIPYTDLLAVYELLAKWCTEHPDNRLFLVPGNHDLSRTVTTMSSFQFLCKLLGVLPNVTVMSEPGRLRGHDAYVIPHVANQELFDIELGKVPDDVATLYLHCNFNNPFAQQADHSLNVSMTQALALPVKHIVFAHEHQHKQAMGGKVQVIGNQIPSSVADCMGNDNKVLLRVIDGNLHYEPVWEASGSFARVDWRDLSNVPADAQFVRVEGDASLAEASSVPSAISKLRSKHDAFVITNAVKIEGRSTEGEAKSLEAAQTYDVFSAVMKRLSDAQQKVVKELLEKHNG